MEAGHEKPTPNPPMTWLYLYYQTTTTNAHPLPLHNLGITLGRLPAHNLAPP